MDSYLRRSLKKSTALQPPPSDGKLRLLKAAAEPASPGMLSKLLRMLFPGTHPLERASTQHITSLGFLDHTMVWAFKSGMVSLHFFS
jgi:hypothetical protein